MRTKILQLSPLILGLIALPQSASALTLIQVLGVFHLFVGLFLTATLGVFISATAVYMMRFGTWPSYRTTAVEAMRWGVAMLFVLIVLLGIVRWFEGYSGFALTLLAVVVIVGLVFVIGKYAFGAGGGGEKKAEKKPGAKPAAKH